jgi:hypothetical protein
MNAASSTFSEDDKGTYGDLSLVWPIPTGLHLSAQGCEERATLGENHGKNPTLKGLSLIHKVLLFNPFRVVTLAGDYPGLALKESGQPWAG